MTKTTEFTAGGLARSRRRRWIASNSTIQISVLVIGSNFLFLSDYFLVFSHAPFFSVYLVDISFPAAATPMTQDSPHPRWATSKAVRITLTFPVQSKV